MRNFLLCCLVAVIIFFAWCVAKFNGHEFILED